MAEYEAALPKLKAAYQAWHDTKGKSIDTWVALLSDQVDWRSLANGQHGVPWTKTRMGPEDVRGYLVGLTTDMDTEHFTVDQYVSQGDTIVMIGATAWRHRSTGKRLETPKVDVWRFKDGKAVAFFEYYDTAAVFDTAATDPL